MKSDKSVRESLAEIVDLLEWSVGLLAVIATGVMVTASISVCMLLLP